MVDLMAATRAYEANVAAVNATKRVLEAALSIGTLSSARGPPMEIKDITQFPSVAGLGGPEGPGKPAAARRQGERLVRVGAEGARSTEVNEMQQKADAADHRARRPATR